MRKFGNRGGFTLIELVLVIVILSLLAAVAIPKFLDLKADAQEAAERGVVGGVRAGIALWRVGYETGQTGYNTDYPTELDDSGNGTADAVGPFFDNVLDYGIVDSNWSKAGTAYTGPDTGTYTYDSADGSFD